MDNPNANDRAPEATPPIPSAQPPSPAGTVAPAPPLPEPNTTLREWLSRNGVALVILLGLFLFLYWKFDVEGLWNIVKVCLGLGLVIFIHELGHFAVAKWCNVHVETFSIGFGPALPGCKWVRGETTYMIALIPLGGYVKMVGEGSEGDEGDDDPRSFKNKTVWQRMAIISAGVIMNVLLAFVCFILVFQIPGKPRTPAVVGMVDSGSPAWVNGIPAGAWVHKIGDADDPYFHDILPAVMSAGGELVVEYSLPPSTERHHLRIVPQKDEQEGRQVIGIAPTLRLALAPQRYLKGRKHPVLDDTAAARAEPPFQFEDVIIGCTDPAKRIQGNWRKDWTRLPLDPRFTDDDPLKDSGQADYFVFDRRMQQLAGQRITVRVRHKDGEEASIRVPPAYHRTFGLRMQMGQITAVRKGSPASDKVQSADPFEKRTGDVIEQVEVREKDGRLTRFLFPNKDSEFAPSLPPAGAAVVGLGVPTQRNSPLAAAAALLATPDQLIDPTRLRFELQQWAARNRTGPRKVTLKVRHQNRNGSEYMARTLVLEWDDRLPWRFDREVPYNGTSPEAIPELGIAFHIRATVSSLDPHWAGGKEPSLQRGDVITQVRFWFISKKGELEADSWRDLKTEQVKTDQWAHVWWRFQNADINRLDVKVKGSDEYITLHGHEDRTWPLAERGLILNNDKRMQKADSIGEAVLLGLNDTKKMILQIYQNLQGMLTGRISLNNLGGPITISRMAYSIAGENFWEFVFFLGMISINLAVVNFLPIPVLDGGHMVFLIYEKIRGKPASEHVRVGATIVGLLMLATLLIFVTYRDILKIFGK